MKKIIQAIFLLLVMNTGLKAQFCLNSFTTSAYSAYRNVVTADFNSDGNKDIAYCINSTAALILGNGNGTFGSPLFFPISNNIHCSSIATQDFNNDGHMDLALSGYDASFTHTVDSVCVIFGTGTGSFVGATQFSVNAPSGGTTSGGILGIDINNDGNKDIIMTLSNGGVFVKLGNGSGGFGATTSYTTNGLYANHICSGDFNADGNKDIAVSNLNSDNISVMLGNGLGALGTPTLYAVGGSPQKIISKDFNLDGILDLAVANSGSTSITVYIGTGSGSFGSAATYAAPVGSYPYHLTSGDFNGDGNNDIVLPHWQIGGGISILPGSPTGTFGTITSLALPSGSTYCIYAEDFNNDNLLDIFAGDEAVNPSVYLNTAPTVSISGSGTICSGATVTLTASGATSYSWSTGSTSNTIAVSPTVTTVYSVIGTSVACSTTKFFTVTVNSSPNLTISASSTVLCSGNSATLTASGASTYTWSGGPSTATFVVTPTATTNYTVTGTSAAGCTNTAIQSVSVNATPTIVINNTGTVICTGNSTTLTGTGASTYSWSGGPSTASYVVSPTVTTTYTLVGTGATGCTNIAMQTVSVNTTPTLAITPSSTVICSGNTATLTASGASTYTWSGGPLTAAYAVSPTVTTVYTVSGTSSGCTNTAVQSLSVNTSPTVSISSTGTVICSGFNTTLTAGGAASYAWFGGPPTSTFMVSPISTSNFSVVGTAANGCTNIALQSVSVNPTPTVTISPSSTVTCTGKSAVLTANNATTYTWTSGPTTASYAVSPTVTTDYTVTGTAAGGCTNTAVQSISVIASPTVNITNTGTVLCAGETTTLNSSGASIYAWASGPGTSSYAVTPTVTTTYTLTGTAANGCTANATQQVSVNPLPPLVITPSSTVICSGKSATFTASGASTYTWTGGPGTPAYVISPSVTTVYTVSGTTAASGCTNSIVQTLSVNATPTITIAPSSTVLCFGKTATLTASGGNNYTWTAGPLTSSYAVTPASTTNYTVTGMTAVSGCTNVAVQSVSVNALTGISITPAAPVICSGNTSTITASGVSTYTWSGGGPTTASYAVTPSVTTSYTVTGTDAATNCSNTAVVSVSVNATPTVSVNSGSICSGNNFIIIPSGASTYTVSGGSTIVSPSVTSTYSITGTSAAGCVATNTAISTVSVFITPTVSVNSGSICTGNSFTMTPSGAATYTYSSGTNIVSPMTTTSYSVTGSSTAGCISANIAISDVTVNVTPTIAVNSGTLCTGKVFTMVPSGASTYTYSSGSATVNPLVNTSYSVIGTSAAGCVSNNTAVSTVTVYITPTVAATSGSICTGNSFVIVPSGASTYTITGSGSFTVSPTAFTNYSVVGTSTDGCVSANTATSSVTPYTTPTISIMPTPANGIICVGQYAWMVANGAATYTWLSGPTSQAYTVNPTSNSSYTVVGTAGSSGCTNTAVFNLTVNTTPTVTIVPSTTLLCSGQSATLTANGTSTYSWFPTASNLPSPAFSPTATTNYTVVGTAANNCTALAVQSISVNLTPTLTITPSNSIFCSGSTATLVASGANTYSWSTSVASPTIIISPSVTTGYSVIGTSNSCTSSAAQTVSVNITPTVTLVPSNTVMCTGKTITISASGAGTYTWSTASTNSSIAVSPTSNITYTVNATSAANNCTTSAVQSISVNITPTVTITPSSTLICTGRSATFTANGANTYTWTNAIITPSQVLSPSVTTNYSVMGTSISGCTNTAAQTLSVNVSPTLNLTQTSTLICSGKSVTLSVTGASTYSWNTGASSANLVFSPTVTTNYSVIGFASNNCTNSAATSVSVNTSPTISVNSGTICAGDIFTITPSGAGTYTISGGSNTVSPATNTLYTVVGTSTNGCISTNTPAANVAVNPLPSLTVNSGSICIGNSFTLNASGASSYTWDSGANTSSIIVSPTVPTTYTVSASNSFNCIKTRTTSVIALLIPNVSISGNNGVCVGKSATLTANGANSFTWSPGAQTTSVIVVSPSVATTYSVKGILGSNSCSNTAAKSININPLPIISISGNTFVCKNSPVILTANGANTYTWSESSVSNSITITPTVNTTYSVLGRDTLGCEGSASYTVNIAPMITPSLCLVTVDSLSDYNEIYWDKTLFPRADTFIVYRENDASIYSVIARIPKSANSMYIDTNRSLGPNVGNPNQSFYKYKLQYRDSCGNLSVLSQWHQTIKVNDYQNGIFTWNYYNIGGVDYQFANYYLWRYHTLTGTLTLLGGTSGNSFTDPLYNAMISAGDYKWYVTTSGFNCNPSLRSAQTSAIKNGTKSNNSNERQFPTPEGVNENLLSENNFNIYPNPATSEFSVEGEGLDLCIVTITDLLGKDVFVPFMHNTNGLVFDSHQLKQGLYLINIHRGKEKLVKKLIIN